MYNPKKKYAAHRNKNSSSSHHGRKTWDVYRVWILGMLGKEIQVISLPFHIVTIAHSIG